MKLKQVFLILLSLLLVSLAALPAFADEGDNDAPFVEPTEGPTETTTEGSPDADAPAPADGLLFDQFGTYSLSKRLGSQVRVIEAELFLENAGNDAAGVLFSNEDKNGDAAYLTLSIYKRGVPRVTYLSDDGISYDFRFEKVDVRGKGWVHLAIVLEPDAGAMHCYLDGVLAETLTMDRTEKPYVDYRTGSTDGIFFVGGDATEKNPNPFTGAMRALSVFSAPRTAQQIASDVNGVDATDETLLCSYALSAQTLASGATDASGRGNDLKAAREWFPASAGAYVGDYDYSLAVVGDTQSLTTRDVRGSAGYVGSLAEYYTWIVDRIDEKKIQYVIGLGDITELGEDWGHKNNDTAEETAVGDREWRCARDAISLMNGKVPYSLIRGSGHDGKERFNQWFADQPGYTENIAGYYKEGRVENVYHTFRAGETDYMILCLDFGAKDDVLEWANELVAAHPNHRVIVTTHAYMEKDGTHLVGGEEYSASKSYYDVGNNDGDDLWNKFISRHENIFLVLSGHMSADTVVINQRKGEKGNTVTEMLIDPQTMDKDYAGGTGMIAMLYFSKDSDVVGVEYYSTRMNVYRALQTFDINHTHDYKDTVVPPTCEGYGYTAHVCDCGHALSNTNLVPRLPHTYADEYDADCDVCGEGREVDARPVETLTQTEESDTETPSEIPSETLPESPSETLPESTPASPSETLPETPSETLPESESLPASESESVADTEPATEAPSAPPAEGEGGDGDGAAGEVPMTVMIVTLAVGGVALLGIGGFALWTVLFKKKR